MATTTPDHAFRSQAATREPPIAVHRPASRYNVPRYPSGRPARRLAGPRNEIRYAIKGRLMGEKAGAFAKGGCGCLIAFAAFALIAVVLGGNAHIDIGGAVLLFIIGGVIGLVALAIYNKGKRDK